jgi:hypothetical protein
MNEQQIARLEAQLERLVEGAFANIFGRHIRAQDIALQLARAMEDNQRTPHEGDPRPIAPDEYVIYANPTVQAQLLQSQPMLLATLSRHMVELAAHSGYRLVNSPIIKLVADAKLDAAEIVVRAEHTNRPDHSTAVMERVDLPPEPAAPSNPQLIIGVRVIPLNLPIVNIGRSRENHVVVDDAHVSRHHVQLRLRFGVYTLFDIQSHGGTFVNGMRVKECRLRSGDVIGIGRTQIVYLQDEFPSDSETGITGTIDPVS